MNPRATRKHRARQAHIERTDNRRPPGSEPLDDIRKREQAARRAARRNNR